MLLRLDNPAVGYVSIFDFTIFQWFEMVGNDLQTRPSALRCVWAS